MATSPKTDYIGLAQTGLEIYGNDSGASNQNNEIPGSDGSLIHCRKFGSIKAPHVDYKITGTLANLKLGLGKVHGTENAGPYALRSIQIHTGAGEEKTFGADAVQIQAGATKTLCTYDIDLPTLDPSRHASTFGAFTFEETPELTLQSGDFSAEAEIDPTTIEGVPKAADAVKAFEQVVATMWTANDTTPPAVAIGEGWIQFADWNCSGADGQMFVWTATFKKYLKPSTAA